MSGLNQQLFLLLNASAISHGWVVQAIILLADSPVVVGPAVLVGLWVWGPTSRRGALLSVAGAMLAGQAVNQLLGLVIFDPRPFMVPLGHTLMTHVADNGFPSDHATFTWTLGVGLILTAAALRWGAFVCAYGVAVAWSRVWLGIHFPEDMMGSAFVAFGCGGLARLGAPVASTWLLPFTDRSYQVMLRLLHLPPALFPRGPEQ